MNKKTKNSKATKAIALTLAGIAAIGAGSIAASNMKDAKAMRILGGLKAIFTGSNTSNGSAYQGIQKSVSTVNNNWLSKFKAGNSSATVTTSRGLNGSKGSINTGSTTSNGSAYQGTPKSDSLVNNSAFDTTVKKHSPVTKQMMAVEKQVATSSKNPLTKNQSTQTSTTQSKGTQTTQTSTLRLNVSKDSNTSKTTIEPAVDTSKSDLTKASQKLQKHFSFKTK